MIKTFNRSIDLQTRKMMALGQGRESLRILGHQKNLENRANPNPVTLPTITVSLKKLKVSHVKLCFSQLNPNKTNLISLN